MSILNKYKRWVTQIFVLLDKYWDFVLSMDNSPSEYTTNKLTTRCLASYVDMTDNVCIEENGVVSRGEYVYDGAYNDGYDLMDIGFTGIDNGLVKYDYHSITNRQFFEIFANSRITEPSGDTRLHMISVTGNTGVYSYDSEYIDNSYFALKGGFFQGFYKLFGFDYEVLPQYIENSWYVEVVMRPKDYDEKDNTLNSTHPDNKGIFFYMGTRAENKFLQFYNTDISGYEDRIQEIVSSEEDSYFAKEEVKPEVCEPILPLYGENSCEDTHLPCGCTDNSYLERAYSECGTYIEDVYNGNTSCKCRKSIASTSNGEFFLERFLSDYGYNEESNCCTDETCRQCNDEKTECEECKCGKCGNNESEVTFDCGCNKNDRKVLNKRKAFMLSYFLNQYGFNDYSTCRPCRSIGCNEEKDESCGEGNFYADDYFMTGCDNGSFISAFDSEYYEEPISLSGVTVETSNGHKIDEHGYYEIETDNKFITHNRTLTGFTVNTWDEDVKFVLTGITEQRNDNLFILMNRTKTGYTVNTLDSYYESEKPEYDFLSDIKGNCFAAKVNDDGSLGYKYLVKSCDNENGWEVLEETSLPGLIKKDEWNTVGIRFAILNGSTDSCGIPIGERLMKIYFYVNGKLKFISKELKEFSFRELNDTFDKQEGVPFNVSLGGGTQGLCDSVWLNYRTAFEKILPIEENFAGTFIGDISAFRFYTCPLSYAEIKSNDLYERSVVHTLYSGTNKE